MTLVAGGTLWINMREYTVETVNGVTSYNGKSYSNTLTIHACGWPARHRMRFTYSHPDIPAWSRWQFKELALNLAAHGTMLFCVAALLEWRIRRTV